MAEATVAFDLGAETVTSVLEIDLVGSETILTGDIDAVVAAGTVARLRGNCRLVNNLHVRGTLVADPTGVNLDGQGLWDIHTHDGGVLNLVGTEKTAWCRWGDTPIGWAVGDRLAVAPTQQTFNAGGVMTGVFAATETTWMGLWSATTRPASSSDVTLVDGSIARPEVVNLSQSLVIRNVTRIMLHESDVPNVHTLKWLRVLNSGKPTELTFYPIHFHKLGDTCRGSELEGIVVEGGKQHAFVTHASHGVTLTDCVAFNTVEEPFWWDDTSVGAPDVNRTHDAAYLHCLALGVLPRAGTAHHRLDAFHLGLGTGNRCIGSATVGVLGGDNSSGFHWPEQQGAVWEFVDNVAHNNKTSGIFVWQNSDLDHVITDFVAYRCGKRGIEHGAYRNSYLYEGGSLTNVGTAITSHALSRQGDPLLFDHIPCNGKLEIKSHNQPSTTPVIFRNVPFTSVVVNEAGGTESGVHRFEDCGLSPSDFTLTFIKAGSVLEIVEGGVLTDRWVAGSWT